MSAEGDTPCIHCGSNRAQHSDDREACVTAGYFGNRYENPVSAEVTPEQMAEWRALAAAATKGPWGWGGSGVGTDYWDGREEFPIAKTDWTAERGLSREWMDRNRDNGRFIAAARTAVPALLDEVERLTAERDEYERRWEEDARPAFVRAEKAEADLRALRDAVAALAGEWAMRGMRNKSRVWVESSADLLALLSDGPSA